MDDGSLRRGVKPEIVVAMAGKNREWSVAAHCEANGAVLSRNVGPQSTNCRTMWYALEVGLDLAEGPSDIIGCYTDISRVARADLHFRNRDIDIQGRVFLKLAGHEYVFRHKRDIAVYAFVQNLARQALLNQPVWVPDPDETDRALRLARSTMRSKQFWNAYNLYLKSPEWSELRRQVIQRDKVCVRCGRSGAHVHHLTYERVFREDVRDLVFLCFECHDLAHSGKLTQQKANRL